jgi:hypothetical protein
MKSDAPPGAKAAHLWQTAIQQWIASAGIGNLFALGASPAAARYVKLEAVTSLEFLREKLR